MSDLRVVNAMVSPAGEWLAVPSVLSLPLTMSCARNLTMRRTLFLPRARRDSGVCPDGSLTVGRQSTQARKAAPRARKWLGVVVGGCADGESSHAVKKPQTLPVMGVEGFLRKKVTFLSDSPEKAVSGALIWGARSRGQRLRRRRTTHSSKE